MPDNNSGWSLELETNRSDQWQVTTSECETL